MSRRDLFHGLTRVGGVARTWWARWPGPVRGGVVLLLLAGVGLGTYEVVHRRVLAHQQADRQEGWRRFDAALARGDEPAMQEALAYLATLDPPDSLVAARQTALATGQATTDDPVLAIVTLRQHLRADRLPEAAREADIVLLAFPDDWLAQCVKAAEALRQGDRAGAGRILDRLDPLARTDPRISPGGLILAYRLHDQLGRDSVTLRRYVQSHWLPQLRSPALQQLPLSDRVGLLEVYARSWEPDDRPQPPAIVQAWVPVAELADRATTDAIDSRDVGSATRLGQVSDSLAQGLAWLARHQQLTPEQLTAQARDLLDRQVRTWEYVRSADPRRADAYAGLARTYERLGKPQQANETLTAGLKACDDDPRLLTEWALLLQRYGQALPAWEGVRAAAERHPDRRAGWILAAETALMAGRRDLALTAVERLRTLAANDPALLWIEARIWLDGGEPSRALERLDRLGEKALLADPRLVRAYTRALAEAAPLDRLLKFLDRLEQGDSPTLLVAGLRGVTDAPASLVLATQVEAATERAQARWPLVNDWMRIRAEMLRIIAEYATPIWDPVRVRKAIQAWERVRAAEPGDLAAALTLARLRLSAEQNAAEAWRDLAPVLALTVPLPAPAREVIAAVQRERGQLDEADRLLQSVCEGRDASAGTWIERAKLELARDRIPAARQMLDEARMLPRTPGEQQQFQIVARRLTMMSSGGQP